MRIGVMFRFKSFWIGWHYGNHNKRLCVNIIPCVTIWITLKGGIKPIKKLM